MTNKIAAPLVCRSWISGQSGAAHEQYVAQVRCFAATADGLGACHAALSGDWCHANQQRASAGNSRLEFWF